MDKTEPSMKMSDFEKKQWMERRKTPITPKHEKPPRVGPGRENEIFECAATRRAAGFSIRDD